jgi:hypothetical protein
MRRGTRTASALVFTLVAAAALAAGADKGEGAKAAAGRTRVVRSWLEPLTVDGEAVMRRISYIFDYDAGVFRRTVRT